MKSKTIGLLAVAPLLAMASALLTVSCESWERLPRKMTAISAAVVSAPFVGCEPRDMNVLRVENAQGNSSWVVHCRDKEFICGVSRSRSGHTVFCHQINCAEPSGQPSSGKFKV